MCALSSSPRATLSRMLAQEASLERLTSRPYFLKSPFSNATTKEAQSVSGMKPSRSVLTSGASPVPAKRPRVSGGRPESRTQNPERGERGGVRRLFSLRPAKTARGEGGGILGIGDLFQRGKFFLQPFEGPRRGEGPDVELIENEIFDPNPLPMRVGPSEGVRIDDLERPVNPFRIPILRGPPIVRDARSHPPSLFLPPRKTGVRGFAAPPLSLPGRRRSPGRA